MIIKHAAIEDKWLNEKVTKLLYRSNTLVLGSFNPNNQGNNTDFYYGRCSNFFWKTIAEIEGRNEQFYCNNLKNKIHAMEEYSAPQYLQCCGKFRVRVRCESGGT